MYPYPIIVSVVAIIALVMCDVNMSRRLRQALSSSAAIVHEQRARHHTIKGDSNAKQTHYRRAAERWEEAGQRGRAARNWATWYMNKGEFLVAADRFAEALAHHPADAEPDYRPRLLVQQMLALGQAGRYSTSLTVAQEVVAENAAGVVGAVAFRMVAMSFGRVGLFAEAEKQLQEAAGRDKTPAEEAATLGVRCLILQFRGHVGEILSLCQAHIASANHISSQIFSYYGIALSGTGRHDEAVVAFERAIVQAPITEPMTSEIMIAIHCCSLARARIDSQQYAIAEDLLVEVTGKHLPPLLHRFHIPSLRLLNASLAGAVHPETVVSQAETFLTVLDEEMVTFSNPTDALRRYSDTLFYVARALFAACDVEGCQHLLQRFAGTDALSPGMTPTWHFWRGRCEEAEGNLDAAIAEYEAATHTAPDSSLRYVVEAEERLSALRGRDRDVKCPQRER